ncbi:MAG: ATP-grasp domain-containing protein [Verrucomicrobia bacterium]|nr:ATP-grasp domain-containing protein [Verrucomicrobiota bacterium]
MPLTLLLTSAGRRVELLGCFRESARRLGIQIRVLAADMLPQLSAACQMADESFEVPACHRPDYPIRLLEICGKHGVDVLVPTIDTELQVLADSRAQFQIAGTQVMISTPEVVGLARNKIATSNFLDSQGIPVPRTLAIKDFEPSDPSWRWPAILKPVDGSCSKGVIKVDRESDWREEYRHRINYLIQEFWEGAEYTVNLFFDRDGCLRSAVPHRRLEVRAGEVSKGRTERVGSLMDIADRFGRILTGARGALCFQAILRPSGEAAVFEINARFGGGYPLAHAAGGRFTQWLLEEAQGMECTANQEWQEGLVMLRYDAALFKSTPL